MRRLLEKLLTTPGKKFEFLRFCMVGGVATVIHYGIYLTLQTFMDHGVWLSLAYTIGYCTSLVCNFFMTTYFTFHTRASVKKATGFGFSHLVNYLLHIVLFNIYIALGVNKVYAPVFVLMVAVPVNYTILHFVFTYKKRKRKNED